MGMTSSRESGAQSPSSPTHNNAGELTSVLGGVAITTNVTPPATAIRRSGSTSKMLQQSWKTQENQHLRANSLRIRTARPMPDHNELNERFAKVLESMDLPPDKAKRLKNYDNKKKWEMLCDQEAVSVKEPPSHYLTKLRTYLDPKASRSYRKRRIVGESTSTEVLRNLEISLRTNHIEWVKEFLDETNQGLDSLVDYLSFRLQMMRYDQRIQDSHTESDEQLSAKNVTTMSSGSGDGKSNGYLRPSLEELIDSPHLKRRTRHVAKLNMGTSDEDIHVCIMCLRAIMNNKFGFNMVIQHREAINCIALSLIHKSLRTKALVLELLAAICLVKGGHEIILSAFDSFKDVCHETKRFQTLMNYFMFYEMFNIDFMVACMQFINIVVHSVEDMNYRVHLQYEFTSLGLDEYLEKLRLTESIDLQIQIHAYLDNVFNVAALMEDSETKTAALERVQLLEEDLSRAWENERDFMYKITELNSELQQLRNERDALSQIKREVDEEVSTLRKVLKQNELELKNRENMLETKKLELQQLTNSLPKGATIGNKSDDHTNANRVSNTGPMQVRPEPEPVKAPPPPPPPLPAMHKVGPPIPPPPPGMGANRPSISAPTPPGFMPNNAMTIKRQHLHKYKLPTINWIALKPNQVRGTIFNEMDDDKLHAHIDFVDFEEKFKIGMAGIKSNGSSEPDGMLSFPSKRVKKPENVSLLEHTRLRNIAISRRKLGMTIDAVTQGINMLDLKQISLENVEILQKMIPTEQEVKAYKEYIIEKKDPNLLTDEDKFIMQLTKSERISSKLAIMNYMGNFFDSVHLISPQIEAILNASQSMKSSKKFRSVLEIVLAFGNYLNSSKRGPAYGFKLQSLDTLLDTKSSDKRICLLHYIVMTIRQKFPHLMDFDTELFYIDKAAQVSLENVVVDVAELDKGMEIVRKEAEVRTKGPPNLVLKDFLTNSEDKLRKMKQESKKAQDAFKECVEYFGDSSRNTDANTFFSLLVRFVRAVKTVDKENEQRRLLEQAAARKQNDEVVSRNNQINSKKQQEAVINELKTKSGFRDKICIDMYNGALEEIILDLKKEPYRRADAVRRSHRRRIDSHRMSRTVDDIDV